MPDSAGRFAVIMAGGVGSRFWPVSTPALPKQFLDLTGTGRSLLQQTYDRVSALVPDAHILVLTNARYIAKVREQLPGIPTENIVAEPAMRNTAPAILLAANIIDQRSPGAVMAVMPSDHFIGHQAAFLHDLARAMNRAADKDVLITLGIRPDRPHTGYGYIQFDTNEPGDFKPVLRFTEKPGKQTAETFLAQGNYLWNAGIFVWRSGVIRKAYAKYLPEMFRKLERVRYDTEFMARDLAEIFPGVENISVDYGIMEKAGNVEVLPVDFGWNDLGSWDAVYRQLARREGENIVLRGSARFENARGNLVYSDRPDPVIIDGLNGFLFAESGGRRLLIPLERSQDVKKWRDAFPADDA